MKIKIKSLGLPRTTGTLKRVGDRDDYGTTNTEEVAINEIYTRDRSGDLRIMEAGSGVGFLVTFLIPFNAFETPVSINMSDVIEVDSVTYRVMDIQHKIQSQFEDHYFLNMSKVNTDAI
jgi:hypothetical protein